jgi:hypothetical protein
MADVEDLRQLDGPIEIDDAVRPAGSGVKYASFCAADGPITWVTP